MRRVFTTETQRHREGKREGKRSGALRGRSEILTGGSRFYFFAWHFLGSHFFLLIFSVDHSLIRVLFDGEGVCFGMRNSLLVFVIWPDAATWRLGRSPVNYTQLRGHSLGPKASHAAAKSAILRRPHQIACGPGGGSLARLL